MTHHQQFFPTSAIVIFDRPDSEGISSVVLRWKTEPHGRGHFRSETIKVWEGARGSGCGDDPAGIEREIAAWRATGAEVQVTDLRELEA